MAVEVSSKVRGEEEDGAWKVEVDACMRVDGAVVGAGESGERLAAWGVGERLAAWVSGRGVEW